jgi:hypothetical protein
MRQEGAFLQILVALLLALTAAVASTPIVREKMANRHPRPLTDVVNELGESIATQVAAMTD